MKTTTKIILTFGLTLLMFGCNQSSQKERMETKNISSGAKFEEPPQSSDLEAKNSINGFISSSAAVETGKDTTRKFIRTAEMKFRVKIVTQTTYQIEDLTKNVDGFVSYTHLESEINRQSSIALSEDSTLETIYYTVSNSMTLRVPNKKLDTALKSIAKFIEYLDYRTITAKDVSLELLSNKLKQDRMKKSELQSTTTVESGGKNVVKSQRTEENPLHKQEISDEAKLANLSLDDQINFSTIHLNIYQREQTKRWVIPNDKNIDAYEPSLGRQLLESLKYGWDILKHFFVFITKLWGLILFAIFVYVLYKKFGHKIKIKK